MANIVICCDGTWNTSDNSDGGRPAPTNVRKIYTSLSGEDANGEHQKKYYRKGVGTSGGWFRQRLEGGLGIGIDKDIQKAYVALANLYEEGDKIFLIGFSRGAFTARSVTGLIHTCGLPNFRCDDITEVQKRKFGEDVFNQFRGRGKAQAPAGLSFHKDVEVEFLGVFDTVGALGVPDELDWFSYLFKWIPGLGRSRLRFEDTELSPVVKNARHALAIDERRRAFTPTVWTNQEEKPQIKEKWFPGVHSDIGGGYEDTNLSDFPLEWMMEQASEFKLCFDPDFADQVKGDPRGELHESATSVFRRMRLRPRAVPHFNIDPTITSSAAQSRQNNPPIIQPYYWKTFDLEPGEERSFYVNAKSRWDPADLYVRKGQTYQFKASGSWHDKTIKTGPNGNDGHLAHFGFPIAVVTWSAQLMANIRGGLAAKGFGPLTRRQPQMPWLALVGCVANGREVNSETQEIEPHQHFLIGDGEGLGNFKPDSSGFLYCYANDVWKRYQNNSGHIWVTVTNTTTK